MKEAGRVLAVSGEDVTVLRDAAAVCFGCMNYGCQKKRETVVAENRTGLPVLTGQVVETEFPLKTALAQGLPLLLFPFFACAAVYLASGILFPASKEPLRAALGTAALFITGFIFCLYRRKHPFKTRPVITRII
ncbi:MAG: SoxR reducing system RseC family protein [Treponema sp.]|nr:SoxR reducing system RseC family protein [Treponema sp.]